jgi:hypothetical protein
MSNPRKTSRTQERVVVEPVAARADVVRAALLSGEIREAGKLCDVISFLAHASWWGELVVFDGETIRSLYFDEGHIVGAESNAEAERLGAVLCRHGMLTHEQVETSRTRARERNLRFGEAVVELGYLGREQLFEAMPRQVEDIVLGIGTTEQARFEFFEGFDDRELAFRQRRSADALLLDALRRMDERKLFECCIPTDEHVPVRAFNVPPPPEDPFGVYAAIDGRRSVAQVAASVGLEELDVTRALVRHVRTGHAAIKPPRPDMWRTIEIYNDAIATLLHEVDELGIGDAVRAPLSAFAAHASARPFFAPPAADGTLDAAAAVDRVLRSNDPRLVEEELAQWLYDYASYAIFLARPHLDRQDATAEPASGLVSRRFADMLAPIRPAGEPTLAPPEAPALDARARPTLRLGPKARGDARAPDDEVQVAAPRVSTQRMHKAPPPPLPGVDPTRTARMKQVFADSPRRGGTARRAVAVVPVGSPRPAFVLPPPKAPPRPLAPERRPRPVALIAVASVVVGLLAGAGGHRLYLAARHGSTALDGSDCAKR